MTAIADLEGTYERGRVELIGEPPNSWRGDWRFIIARHDDGRAWSVTETGQQWDAWPWPESDEPGFDDQAYMQEHLRGRGTTTALEKIRELIGAPQ
jgi:hypothetical protein